MRFEIKKKLKLQSFSFSFEIFNRKILSVMKIRRALCEETISRT